MKKKIINISLALLLVLSVCLSVSASVSAESDKKPIAWVNSGSNTNHTGFELVPRYHSSAVCSVKLLSDGTTVGKVITHYLGKDGSFTYTNTFDQEATLFYKDNNSKVAQFVCIADGYRFRVTLVDNGEGKNAEPDTVMWEIWVNVMPPEAPPLFMWIPLFGPQPMPLANGNNQIHLPDEE